MFYTCGIKMNSLPIRREFHSCMNYSNCLIDFIERNIHLAFYHYPYRDCGGDDDDDETACRRLESSEFLQYSSIATRKCTYTNWNQTERDLRCALDGGC